MKVRIIIGLLLALLVVSGAAFAAELSPKVKAVQQ